MTKKEIYQKFKTSTEISQSEFEEVLKEFGLMDAESSMKNAQILCHGMGKVGIEHLDQIINETGLRISNRQAVDEDAHIYVSEGLLSTNVVKNNVGDNSINIEETFSYKYDYKDEKGEYYTIVSAIPIQLGDFVLGRIASRDPSRANCVLDDLMMHPATEGKQEDCLPKEFILGVLKEGPDAKRKFQINENFFALKESNTEKAIEVIERMFKNSKFESQENYYDTVNKHIEVAKLREERGLAKADNYEHRVQALDMYTDYMLFKQLEELGV